MSYYSPANRGPISHASFAVNDLERSTKFYTATFSALGWTTLFHSAEKGLAAFGPGYTAVALWEKKSEGVKPAGPASGTHVAFQAPNQQAVVDWHIAALANGGKDNGAPGLRPYGPDYFAAYATDPDGHAVEVVWHLTKEELDAIKST